MKGRKHRETGGVNEAKEDLSKKPESRNAPNNVAKEAEEMKKGGRAKRARGGKSEMKVMGEKAAHHAGRKPRKNGGRTGSDSSPFTSARNGKEPVGHKTQACSE
jgi:hypothetical protein